MMQSRRFNRLNCMRCPSQDSEASDRVDGDQSGLAATREFDSVNDRLGGQNQKSPERAEDFGFTPTADIRAKTDVRRFVPTGDICSAARQVLLFDHLVGAGE